MLRIATKFFTGNNFKFATAVQKSTNPKSTSSGDLTYYKDGQLVSRSAIVLKEKQDIEAYVIKIIQNYPRSTFKNGIKSQSVLKDHGLDSLDSIQVAMQIEEDLGYVISAQTLSQFNRVSHYIHYIQQVQAFKRENNKAPLP